MADVDIDPFGEHESRPEEPTDGHIPLDPVTPGRSTWEPDRGEQETSFGGESQRTKLMKDYVKDLYKRLSENIGETPELFHYDYFKLEGRELYYIGSRKPLTIPLDPVTPGRSTWEPDRGEQETSFGGESQRTKLMKDYVKDLYKRLSENIGETPELFHYEYFKLEGRELYYIGSRKPLTTEGKLKSVGMIADILGKNRLRRLGFNIPVGHLIAWQAVMLNKSAEELPSESDITKVDDIELQEIIEKASGIISQIKDVQTDTEDYGT